MFLHPDCTLDAPAKCCVFANTEDWCSCRVSEIQRPQAHTNAQGAQHLHSWPAGEAANVTTAIHPLGKLAPSWLQTFILCRGTNFETSFYWLCSAPPVFLCEGCGWAHTCDEGCRECVVVDVAGVGAGDLVCPISGYCSGRLLSAGEVCAPPPPPHPPTGPGCRGAHQHRRHSVNGLHSAMMCSRLYLIAEICHLRKGMSAVKAQLQFVACRHDQTS